ncbi:MAG: 16S rRNA (guanine(527)-N(7))-methyltransferase RsmG [Oscillospiraceae bacterium]|jgi:16S rRNA (guanine527-N7)-methyltransferase|nr:16S rRNA (guanine(527)-N(7))-methyltransferase RsmG [Oscillospiraceae bacterium]MDD3260998.1 16S rRNA (guanine(527)-N(7))-methyltransferase RsmG [Oscillospiraceae bacterium]
MESIEAQLQQGAAQCGISLSKEQSRQFQQYMESLLEWNQKLNLTAITQPQEFLQKHFLDSLWPLQWMQLQKKNCIDVGTGAGFPSIPLKLAVPQMQLTLLDSLQKRLTALQDICETLQVKADFVHGRAEEAGRNAKLRGQFDFAFARAVAPLPVLCEYCLPFVKVGGSFCAWKGPAGEGELAAATHALRALGGKVQRNETYLLPNGEKRVFLMIRRVSPCPNKYPRLMQKIKKQPL